MHEPGFLAASTPSGRRTRDTIVAVRYSDQPQLWDRIGGLSVEVWPEYNLHGDELNRYWDRLYEDFPEYQFVLYDDEDDEVLAEGHTIPCSWDGTVEGLGPGIDSTIAAGFAIHEAGGSCNALAALAAEIAPRFRNRGLASVILQEMVRVARSKRLAHVLAPVRPNWKDRYPLTPIERYVAWTQDDGQPFDPWIRTHVRLGGAVFKPIPRSLRIAATVAEWESWTRMRFPEDGDYVFPAGLATVHIDHALDRGLYWEPNVWIVHQVGHGQDAGGSVYNHLSDRAGGAGSQKLPPPSSRSYRRRRSRRGCA